MMTLQFVLWNFTSSQPANRSIRFTFFPLLPHPFLIQIFSSFELHKAFIIIRSTPTPHPSPVSRKALRPLDTISVAPARRGSHFSSSSISPSRDLLLPFSAFLHRASLAMQKLPLPLSCCRFCCCYTFSTSSVPRTPIDAVIPRSTSLEEIPSKSAGKPFFLFIHFTPKPKLFL